MTTRFFPECVFIAAVLFSPLAAGPLAAADPVQPIRTVEDFFRLQRPVVIGHRGYNQIAPENTLPSFKLAKMAGADMVELDYYNAKDGKLVVIHDETLDRTTDAVARWGEPGIHVKDKSGDALCSLDAGQWFDAKNTNSHLPRYAGTKLPTLAESLDLIQDGNFTLIHHKEGDAATCLRLLRGKNLINQVIVQSFDWNYLKDFHQQEPRQVLGALGPLWGLNGRPFTEAEKVLNEAWVDEIKAVGARVVVWNRQITRESVAYAHAQGLKVWVYTINDAPLANELLDLGADGLITDNTAQMWRALALRALAKEH